MKILDLFSGCGGFALGARQAGFDVALSYDFDPALTFSHARNFPRTRLQLADIAALDSTSVVREFGGRPMGIIGGPPCQGFSSIGKRNQKDPRRSLLHHYFRLVAALRPEFFVMENVVGLGFSDAKPELEQALALVARDYHLLGPLLLDASEFGAATRRKRLFVVGTNRQSSDQVLTNDIENEKAKPATVRDAIYDLSNSEFVRMEGGFDLWRLNEDSSRSAYARRLVSGSHLYSGNRLTRHAAEVVKRFKTVPQGETDLVGRHQRLAWEGLCPTLRAGTGSANGSFQSVRPLHPSEPRVITVREAARLQGFPDAFRFHPTIWHSFRMIGNSVSPFQSKAVLRAVSKKIEITLGQVVA